MKIGEQKTKKIRRVKIKMVWYEIELNVEGETIKGKYTPLNPIEETLPDCDSNGNPLKRISGSFTKAYFVNEATGEKFEKAYKLVKGKPIDKMTGRTKRCERVIFSNIEECEDLIVEKEMILECPKLYDKLTTMGKGIKVGMWFGNGYKAYKVMITPNTLYKGFCNMRAGRTQKSEIIRDVIGDYTEQKRKDEMLKQIEDSLNKVNKASAEDLIDL
jgi:hypothetical protein